MKTKYQQKVEEARLRYKTHAEREAFLDGIEFCLKDIYETILPSQKFLYSKVFLIKLFIEKFKREYMEK